MITDTTHFLKNSEEGKIMGEYFTMVLGLLKGKKLKVVARFNPQSGFGRLKRKL